jgi:ABC-2 type transport system ATP-binding protein
MLQLTDLKKSYGSRIILNIPLLIIPDGTFWIKGDNGSGKTTFMKILAGIIPFEGSILLGNVDLIKSPIAYRQQVSFAEAEPVFPGFVTGWDLIRFVQTSRMETEERTQLLVRNFGIGSFLPYAVGTYASGMIKKLSLLLSFIGEPKLILFDEPLITLDAVFLPILFSLIKERQGSGTSFLISSHQAFQQGQLEPNGKLVIENQTAQFAAI